MFETIHGLLSNEQIKLWIFLIIEAITHLRLGCDNSDLLENIQYASFKKYKVCDYYLS